MTWVTVATAHETEWNKTAALRAATAARVQELVERLLGDLSNLDAAQQPVMDYCEPEALDAIRRNPQTFQVLARLASSGDTPASGCQTTTYWPDVSDAPVDVELEVRGQRLALPLKRGSRRLEATVDPVLDRIARINLS